MPHRKYTHSIKVTEEHIDIRNHVNNLVYLQWCLETAEAHWEQNTTETIRLKYVWYVMSHTITYKSSAFEGDTLEVQTWVEKSEGVRSERHYRIVRPSDNQTLVEAQTTWCLLNAKTLKPTKITDEIRKLFA